jgi:hypothetical protein
MTNAFKYTPDGDIEMSKIGTIKLLCADFSSHEDGLPEWIKNSSDEYIRRDAPEQQRVIVVILNHGTKVVSSLSCLDFGGMSAAALEKNFRKWGRDPEATSQSVDGEQGQHGNGGKCYMVQMFDDHARVVTVSMNKKCVYGVPSGNPRFGYIPSAKEGRDSPVSDTAGEIKRALKELRCEPDNLGPDIARCAREAAGFTLVSGFSPRGLQEGTLSAKGIVSILGEHPQMQISLELCRVYVVENGKLITPKAITLPKIKPLDGFEEPRRIDLPETLEDPTTGANVSTTNSGKSAPGVLVLHTSDVSMRYKKVGRHVINYKATSGWIGYDGVLEFDVSSSYRDRLYGYCTLDALEPFKTNKREHLANSPLTRALKAFIAAQIAEYCVYRPSRSLIPAQAEHPFRAWRSPGAKRRKGLGYFFDFSLEVKPALALRRDSPPSASRWAPWTSRSQIASPTVASPMTACQSLGSSWLVTSVAVTL